MAFEQKVWEDRISEYPTRRTLTRMDGSTEIVSVSRNEGSVSKEGDAFSAKNMNGLEQRIANNFGGLTFNPPMSQAEYDALGFGRPANTIYIII